MFQFLNSMEGTIGFVLIIVTLIINILAAIFSSYTIIYLIGHECRLRDTNLLLVINTYIPILICSFIQVSLNIHAVLGDTNIFININSIACHVRGYIYLYIVIWLFNSFSLQAYIRMLNILYPKRTYLRSLMATMIFIVITWFISFLLIIPTIFLKVIVYKSSEYQCLVDLSMWKGNTYMVVGFYSIPISIIIITYVRVVKFMQRSSLHNQQRRRKMIMRNLMVLQRIVILVCTLIVLGLPSAIFWILGIITGHLYSLTYRIQAMFLAFNIFFLTFAVALTNPSVKRLVPLFNKHKAAHVIFIHTQEQLQNRLENIFNEAVKERETCTTTV